MSDRRGKTLKTTFAVTLVIFASKAAGFIRDIISAGYFATGMERDAYTSAYSLFYLPVLLFNSCITSTLIPLYVDERMSLGPRRADKFASNCINLFAALSFATGLVMLLLAEPLVRLVYAGFDPEKARLTASLTQTMMPSLVFAVTAIVLSSLLNANERYLSAQLTGFPLSFALIVATVCFSPTYGIRAVAWGVFAASILQTLVLLPSASRSIRYSFRFNIRDKRFRRLMALAVPAVLSMAVNELNHLIDKSIASFLNSGDISAMDYAFRLIQFITGVLAVPVTTIMFSQISKCAARRDRKGVVSILLKAVETLSLVLMPILAIGAVYADEIIRLAYKHGKFDEASVAVTAPVFLFYLIGVVGFGLRDLFNRAFHAVQDTRTPMYVACLTVAMNVALNLILSRFMGVNGLALATSVSCGVGALILAILIRKKIGRMGMKRTAVELTKIALATGACLMVSLLLRALYPAADGKLYVLFRLIVCGAVSLAVYLGALYVLRARQLSFLTGMLKRK